MLYLYIKIYYFVFIIFSKFNETLLVLLEYYYTELQINLFFCSLKHIINKKKIIPDARAHEPHHLWSEYWISQSPPCFTRRFSFGVPPRLYIWVE